MLRDYHALLRASKDENATFSYWIYVLWPWTLVIIAWGIILIASSTNHLSFLDHDYLLQTSHLPWLLALIVFLPSWQIMTLAMMLPSTLPLLSLIVSANLGQRSLWLVQTIFILVYALIWTIFALVAFFGDMLVHQLVKRSFWLYGHSWLIGVTVLIIAGIFQLSPFKRYFLKCCQTTCNIDPQPHHLIKLWHFAWQYGWYCVGSCWALMLLIFAIGMKNILYMSALSILILIEKAIPVSQPIRYFIGTTFLILAILWLIISL